jgi:serine/threonine-protein kinase
LPPRVRVCPFCHALQPLAPELTTGSTIDRADSKIVVDAKIGEGGMGVVFRAWRFFSPSDARAKDGPRLVALKALRAHRAGDPRLREYFRREAEALRALSHPNIVQFDEMFELGDTAVLAMELVEGEALSEIIKRHRAPHAGPIPCLAALRALAYFEQLLGALAALHVMGIVHRDVKPQNVLVRRDGIVKLTDFGIAKQVTGDGSQRPSTEAGVAPGTGIYMSPEQVVGEAIDGRSDLYSAAIVFFEMLAARPPFSPIGKSEIEVRHEQLVAMPPTVRSFFAQLPPALDAFFERALAKDPKARFPDAVAMGVAARSAFGLPESDAWRALVEMVKHAKEPDINDTDRMGTLRDIIVTRYTTEPMPARR